jgi:TPR repeat protein
MALALLMLVGCVDKEAKKKEKQAQAQAFMEAESKARAEQEAKEAAAALEAATKGCDEGKGDQCIALGRLLQKDKKDAQAKEAFIKACTAKTKDGCRMAAEASTDGKEKLTHLKSLCALDDADACVQGAALADTLVQGGQLPEPKKPAERDAIVLLAKACDLGAAIACTARGVALVNDDPKGAVGSLTKGCDKNEPTACFQLANMLAEGQGVKKKDPKRAAELKKKACDAGLKDAC